MTGGAKLAGDNYLDRSLKIVDAGQPRAARARALFGALHPRLLADLVLLRDFGDRRLISLQQDRDHLLFGEMTFLHRLPYLLWVSCFRSLGP